MFGSNSWTVVSFQCWSTTPGWVLGEKDTTRSPSQYISKVLLVSSQPEVFNFRVNNEKCIGAFFCFLYFMC